MFLMTDRFKIGDIVQINPEIQHGTPSDWIAAIKTVVEIRNDFILLRVTSCEGSAFNYGLFWQHEISYFLVHRKQPTFWDE